PPPPSASASASAAPVEPPKPAVPEKKNIVDSAVEAGNFKILAGLLGDAGLVDTLKGAGPFTVLAPTDEAFGKLKAKDLEALKKDKKKLEALLKFHVIGSKAMAEDVKKMKDAATLNGKKVTIKVEKDGTVMVGKAKVTKADIDCSNGVIHVIDTVLTPPAK
ncbi:MAG TPA: fasciclin domain-containing protein, partial [Polyangiaceae bacterium]|nr:fasciclin domain-containing protein [Polyangiaceae bacterium]